MKRVDITNQRFGRLKVISYAGTKRLGKSGKTVTTWDCVCDCGKQLIIPYYRLASGNTNSCGCLRSEMLRRKDTTHGLSKTPLYRVWRSMKDRCYRSKCKGYVNYGGRGIVMCDEWKNDFEIFHNWALKNGYRKGLTIERINNNGNYEPSNCCWIPKSKQSSNRRNCHYITYHGETKTLSEWSRELHVDRETVRNKEKQLGSGELAIEAILNNPRHKKAESEE